MCFHLLSAGDRYACLLALKQDAFKNLRVKCEVTPPLVAFFAPLQKTLEASKF
jgi:hypothetical protein